MKIIKERGKPVDIQHEKSDTITDWLKALDELFKTDKIGRKEAISNGALFYLLCGIVKTQQETIDILIKAVTKLSEDMQN